MIFFTHNGLKF